MKANVFEAVMSTWLMLPKEDRPHFAIYIEPWRSTGHTPMIRVTWKCWRAANRESDDARTSGTLASMTEREWMQGAAASLLQLLADLRAAEKRKAARAGTGENYERKSA